MNKFIAGVFVGATVGILFAPAKGSKTRRRLGKAGTKLKETVGGIKDAFSKKVEDINERINEEVDEVIFVNDITV